MLQHENIVIPLNITRDDVTTCIVRQTGSCYNIKGFLLYFDTFECCNNVKMSLLPKYLI